MKLRLVAATLLLTICPRADAAEVLLARMDHAIGPGSARFMTEVIDRAERDRATCVIFELDTPGGLDESMRTIIKRMLASQVPVVVYVAPSGARAASAGAFITMAAHVAAMAPGTTIGAAHPVSIGSASPLDTNMAAKVTNDSAAYIRSIADQRKRNAQWAELAVRESVALSETEALATNVVDLIAPDIDTLLADLDGRSITIAGGVVQLHTRNATVIRIAMTWRERLLTALSDPNIAYLLLMVGLLGLYFELATPGAVLPGIVGAICLVLAFFSFQTLPVNYAGLLLIILAIVLFFVDVKAATHGVLTVGGLVAMFLGSVMLFNAAPAGLRVSLYVIVPVVLATGAFFALGAWLSVCALRRRPTTGSAGLIGQAGDARTSVGPEGGSVFVAGTHWSAVSRQPLSAGTRVRVVAVDGMTVVVEAAAPPPG